MPTVTSPWPTPSCPAYLRLYALHLDPSSVTLARANADTAISLDPDSSEGHVALASFYSETGAQSQALHEYGVALSLDPSDTRTMTYQAQTLSDINRWNDAEETYKRIIRLRPNYWLAYNELGNNYNAQANYVDALAAYQAAAAAAPGRADPFNNIASMYFQLGDFKEALSAIDKAIALAPKDGFYQTRSDILRAQGRYAEALKSASQGAKLNPDEADNWLEVGDALSLLQHRGRRPEAYRRAAEAQKKQLQITTKNGPGWMLLALYRAKSGDPDSSLVLIRKAESLGAADMYSQLYKVRTLEILGRRDEALSTLATAMRKGVTTYQVEATHDLDPLRRDPRFPQLTASKSSVPQTPEKKGTS